MYLSFPFKVQKSEGLSNPCDIRHFTILQYSRNIITVTMIHCSNTPCKSTKIGRWNRHRNTSIACSGKKSRRPTSRITRNNNIRLINGSSAKAQSINLEISHTLSSIGVAQPISLALIAYDKNMVHPLPYLPKYVSFRILLK